MKKFLISALSLAVLGCPSQVSKAPSATSSPVTSPTPSASTVPENSEDVLVVDSLDLAFRFQKQAIGPVKVFVPKAGPSSLTTQTPESSFQIYEDWSAVNAIGSPRKLLVESYQASLPEDIESLFNKEQLEHNDLTKSEKTLGEAAAIFGLSEDILGKIEKWSAFEGSNTAVLWWEEGGRVILLASKFGFDETGQKLTAEEMRPFELVIERQSLVNKTGTVTLDEPGTEFFNW